MSQPDEISPAQRVASMAMKGAATNVEPEEKLWEGGYSPRAMFGTWILCAIVSALILVGVIVLPGMMGDKANTTVFWSVGLGIIVAVWLIAASVYAYRRIGFGYELTTQRFIHRHGILVRTTDRIELIDIDDVAFTQGLVQRILNVGSIKLSSSDKSHPFLNLLGIEDVNKISGLIDDARRKERRRRSLHIETS